LGIVPTNFGNVVALLIPGKGLKIFGGCAAKFNGLLSKNAAQSKTNHEMISLFINSIC
jgi:hypothetical protein